MSNFMRIAYSTEIYAETMVIFDTTSYNCPAVYEYKASYAEFRCECQFENEGWN